jgi:hypothetical protein
MTNVEGGEMATYDTMATIAQQTAFLRRVGYCLNKAAIAVMAEDAGTAGHAERVVYAKEVLDGTANVANAANAVVTNATLTTNGDLASPPLFGISDSDLEFTVNSMFNAFAGVAT